MFLNFQMGAAQPLAKLGALENLDPYYEKYGWWEFLPEHLHTHEIDGSMYHFSIDLTYCPMVHYHKPIFAEVGVDIPTNLEEFYTLSSKVRSAGYEALAMGDRNGWPGFHMYMAIALRTVPLEDYDKMLHFTTEEYYMADYPGYTEAFQIMLDMEKKNVWAKGVLDMDDGGAKQMFLVRKAAMYESGVWMFPELREALGDDVDWFLFPQIKKDIPIALTASYANEFVLSAFAKPEVKDMVAEFFDYVLSEEGQTINSTVAGTIPIRTTIKPETVELLDHSTVRVIEMFGSGEYPVTDEINIFWGNEAYFKLQETVQSVIAGIKTPEQVVKEFDELAAEIRAQQ